MIEQVRTREEYEARVLAAIERELERAKAGDIASVSTKTAAFYLGKHKDTLKEWRQPPPKGPPFDKGADGVGANNEHVSYPWKPLVAWKEARAGKTAKERKLQDELEQVRQRARELELELQLQEARDHATKLAKKLGRKLGFATLADCTAQEEWVYAHGAVVGHVLTVDDATIDQALDDDRVVSASLADALSLPWAREEHRLPFDEAFTEVVAMAMEQHAQMQRVGRENQTLRERGELRGVFPDNLPSRPRGGL